MIYLKHVQQESELSDPNLDFPSVYWAEVPDIVKYYPEDAENKDEEGADSKDEEGGGSSSDDDSERGELTENYVLSITDENGDYLPGLTGLVFEDAKAGLSLSELVGEFQLEDGAEQDEANGMYDGIVVEDANGNILTTNIALVYDSVAKTYALNGTLPASEFDVKIKLQRRKYNMYVYYMVDNNAFDDVYFTYSNVINAELNIEEVSAAVNSHIIRYGESGAEKTYTEIDYLTRNELTPEFVLEPDYETYHDDERTYELVLNTDGFNITGTMPGHDVYVYVFYN